MKTLTITAIGLLFSFSLSAQTPAFNWATLVGGTQDDRCNDLVIDHNGNILTTGSYTDQADFDPSEETFFLNSVAGRDIYIQKQSEEGELIWAISLGSDANLESGSGIGVDEANNIYVAGTFLNATDFDPGEGEFILNPGTNEDAFLLKLDQDGNFLWVRQFAGPILSLADALTIDNENNIVVVGHFNGTCDFDPGPEIYERTSAGNWDIFIVKLDSEGDFLWAASAGGSEVDLPYDVATDMLGNVFVTGDFNGTANFHPDGGSANLTSHGGTDGFVLKLTETGSLEWVKQVGGASGEQLRSIACDNEGNAIITGRYLLNVDFDPNEEIFELESTSGSADTFIWKLDQIGNLVWVKTVEGSSVTEGMALFIDSENNIYATGDLMGTSDFDTGEGELMLTSVGQDDVYVLRLDESGDTDWAYAFGGTGNNWVSGISVTESGMIVTSGLTGGSADYDQGVGVFTINGIGFGDVFVQNSQQSGLPVSNQTQIGPEVYPIPATDILRIKSESEIASYRVVGMDGKTLLYSPYQGHSLNLNVEKIPSGVYLIILETEGGTMKGKWVK